MQRIQDFLSEPEVDDWASSIKRTDAELEAQAPADKIGFHAATFVWHWNPAETEEALRRSGTTFVLTDINIEFPIGKLTLITGATGSGKSSLLAALLGGETISNFVDSKLKKPWYTRDELHRWPSIP